MYISYSESTTNKLLRPSSAWPRHSAACRAQEGRPFLIDSDAELFMYLIQDIKFGSWKDRRLNRALIFRGGGGARSSSPPAAASLRASVELYIIRGLSIPIQRESRFLLYLFG